MYAQLFWPNYVNLQEKEYVIYSNQVIYNGKVK